MSNKNQEVYIVQANRSAIGAFGGMLSGTKICTFISNDPPSSIHRFIFSCPLSSMLYENLKNW